MQVVTVVQHGHRILITAAERIHLCRSLCLFYLFHRCWACPRLRCRRRPLNCPPPPLSFFTSGRLDVVEPVPDDPTYNVSSELTLVVSRSDDNALITCAVDHPSLAPGDKRSEQPLRVLCESPGKLLGECERGQR